MSAAVRQLSSAMSGMEARRRMSPRPSTSFGTSGCSSTVTLNSSSTGSIAMACLTVHPQLASTRSSRSVSLLMASSNSTSRSLPSLILRIGYSAASRTLERISSGVPMPMVKVDFGAADASRPHSR